MTETREILLTGASGYVGGRLAPVLAERSHHIRALARSPEKLDLPAGAEAFEGDVVEGEGLEAAFEGADVAYYLIHSMGRGSDGEDFAERDRRGARNFGRAAKAAGVGRVVYLGGLGPTGEDASEHLRSRHETAEVLRDEGPPLVYVRAAMVMGSESASFKIMTSLVKALPVMICPRWIDTRSQPVAIEDVVATLAELATFEDAPDEVQLGGADVVTYREMMRRAAEELGRRPPVMVKVPVLTPRLSSLWVSLFTPVEVDLIRPLVDGLKSEMIVERDPPPGINDSPLGFEEALHAAFSEAS
jgi:uncharacterized protein YbjT (DUF2867 family)